MDCSDTIATSPEHIPAVPAVNNATPVPEADALLPTGEADAGAIAIVAGPAEPADRHAAARWLLSALFAIAVHGGVATLMLHWQQPAGASQPAEPIMIDLTPAEPAPATMPEADSPQTPDQIQDMPLQDMPDQIVENVPDQPVAEMPPEKPEPVAPQPMQAENEPQQPEEMKPIEQEAPVIAEIEQKSDVELPRKTEEPKKPSEKKSEPKQVPSREPRREAKPERTRQSAASRSQPTRMAAATPSGSPGGGGPSLSDWRSQVISILERNKRYPPGAESNHEQGVAHLAFALNRQGRVISAHIAGSSGSAALDAETLSLVRRVSFPPPPPDVAGAQINLVVSLRYNVR